MTFHVRQLLSRQFVYFFCCLEKPLDNSVIRAKMSFVKAVTERKISSLSVVGSNDDIQRGCGWCEQLLTDM